MTEYAALLAEISVSRRAGTPQHTRVREVLERELSARGFVVMEHRFAARPRAPLWGAPLSEGVNLIAARPRARVAVWLTAHYDSKGQPLSMASRLALAAAAAVSVPGALAAWLAGGSALAWAVPVALIGALGALSRVTGRSPGWHPQIRKRSARRFPPALHRSSCGQPVQGADTGFLGISPARILRTVSAARITERRSRGWGVQARTSPEGTYSTDPCAEGMPRVSLTQRA